ncbi:MAG TPA: Sir2 family NAD-dependent protein deacetylase [Acidimicrobiia bacterium]|nr:Sir2 family NAD-dependent protein deacetylase [Acidimicrobiia bacterium]
MAGIGEAIDILSRAERILAFTGAGCSTESGIPDFRGPDGLWTRIDPDDFTIDRFVRDRDVRIRSWRMHQRGDLWGDRAALAPNAAHRALSELWHRGRLTGVVTQNIDGLHQAAGTPEEAVAELHGNVRKSLCLGCGATWPTEEVLGWVDAGMEDPHCPRCGGIVKTTTVMFGELLPEAEMAKATVMAEDADAVLVVGSTLGVYPAAHLPLSVVARGGSMVIVNLGPTDHDSLARVKLDAPAGATLTAIADGL